MLLCLTFAIIALHSCKGIELTEVGIADQIQQFGKNPYRILGQEESGSMVYSPVSPYSIHVTMSMILAGFPEDSKTYKQLAKALGVPDTFPKSIQNVKLMIRSFYREVQRKNKK